MLKGVNLEVYRGETLVVMGRSGCGKSVLLKHINGLIHPDRGTLTFDGVDVTAMTERAVTDLRRRVGMLFQAGALFDSLTVAENVAFPLIQHGAEDAPIADRVAELLGLVGLEGTEDQMPSELSGGMRKRAALARALALQPELMLYDEPTTGLDPVTAAQINVLIRDLQGRLGISGVLVTHDIASAKYVADRIAFLYNGQIIGLGTVEQMFRSSDPIVHEFLSADPGRAGGP
ncbi:MAG: ABC transporter ATP-binding protein [Candidatus Binatia bacterium]